MPTIGRPYKRLGVCAQSKARACKPPSKAVSARRRPLIHRFAVPLLPQEKARECLFSVGGIPYTPASGINLIFVGEGFPLPLVENFILHSGGAPLSLPCVRGGAALPRGGRVVPDANFFCILQTPHFYNPSGALAPAPFTQGSLFLVCANIARKHLTHRSGDHWSPACKA